MKYTRNLDLKKNYYAELVRSETHRDYHMGSIKQFNTILQVDCRPDYDLKEPKWDLFKISMSDICCRSLAAMFRCKSSSFANLQDERIRLANGATYAEQLYQLKGSNNRVLLQNAAGTINMVQLFNHPDIEIEDIAWFQLVGRCMLHAYNHQGNSKRLIKMKGGVETDMEYMSCYVELHRIDFNTDFNTVGLLISLSFLLYTA